MRSASSARPCVSSQRGLSGMKRLIAMIPSARIAPTANPSRQLIVSRTWVSS
jgi:hypothetical protein